jgi:hypothetical protein
LRAFLLLLSAAPLTLCADPAASVCADAIHSRVPPAVMRSAAETATTLFRDAGIDLIWELTESGRQTRAEKDTPCRRAGRRILVVTSRFSPRRGNPATLGEASLRGGVVAYYHRIEPYAQRNRVPPDLMLGYVLAHELGHVLLGSSFHSHDGVMSTNFRPHELARMLEHRLRFDALEISVMQARMQSDMTARASR